METNAKEDAQKKKMCSEWRVLSVNDSDAVHLDRVDKPVALLKVSLTRFFKGWKILTSENDCGCDATYALQLGLICAQDVEPQTPPAQSPQKVVSNI